MIDNVQPTIEWLFENSRIAKEKIETARNAYLTACNQPSLNERELNAKYHAFRVAERYYRQVRYYWRRAVRERV